VHKDRDIFYGLDMPFYVWVHAHTAVLYHESQENFKVESWISSDILRHIVAWPLFLIGLWQKTFNFRLSIFKRMRPPICTSKKNLIYSTLI
jgi:hypothetical protein